MLPPSKLPAFLSDSSKALAVSLWDRRLMLLIAANISAPRASRFSWTTISGLYTPSRNTDVSCKGAAYSKARNASTACDIFGRMSSCVDI